MGLDKIGQIYKKNKICYLECFVYKINQLKYKTGSNKLLCEWNIA